MQRVDVVDPEIGVDAFGLETAIGPAAAGFHQRQHDGLVRVAADHRENRRVIEKIAEDREAERVAVVLRGLDHIGDKKNGAIPRDGMIGSIPGCYGRTLPQARPSRPKGRNRIDRGN
jgi:hypothetical protein